MSTITLSVAASVAAYAKAMAEVPGVTQKQAARAALAMQKEFTAAAKASAKAAEKAAEGSGDGFLSHFTFGPQDIVGALSALNDLANSTAALQDQFGDIAATSGLAIDTIAGISLSANAAGGSLDEVGSVLTKLPKQIAAAATGIGATSEAFQRFGIAATNADGSLRSADAVLRDVSDALSTIEDPTQKAAAAVALLGKSGGEVIKAGLGEGSDAIDAFTASAQASGLASQEAADAANAWIAASANLKSALTSTGNQLLVSFGPAAADVINKVSLAFVYLREVAMQKVINGFSLATRAAVDLYGVLAGDISPETARQRMAGLQATIAKVNAEAMAAVKAFHAEIQATQGLGAAAADVEPPIRAYAAANRSASKEADEAAKAAEAQAEALRLLQEQLAEVADANAEAADPIAVAFTKANQELDTLLVNLAQANLLDDEATTVLAEGYARVQAERAAALAAQEQAAMEARDRIAAMEQAAHEKVLAQIEAEKQARLQGFNFALSLASDLTNSIATLAEQQAEKAGKTEKEIGQIRKKAAITTGLINVAQGVTAALASAPPPANFIQAGLTAAAGAIQIGAIAGATYHRGGIAGDEVNATLQKDEGVLTKQGVKNIGGPDVVRRINRGQSAAAPGPINVVFKMGTRTLQEQQVRAKNAPGPTRRTTHPGRSWRRAAR